jgi:chemotaxis protein CheZ
MESLEIEKKEMEFRSIQLEKARQLVAYIEAGDDDLANRLIEELGRMHDSILFQELGKLTRDLHEALNAFRMDSRLSEIAQVDIPDAKERLNYVVVMTEQSAHRTLNAVEESLPMAEFLSRRSEQLADAWRRFRGRDMTLAEFREFSQQLGEFLEHSASDAESIRANLSEVLMAQDFQDLTGQVIRRVINLVQDVEKNLVGLVRISGERLSTPDQKKSKEWPQEPDKAPPGGAGGGPFVPGTADTSEVVCGQDDVDDLLSSLGF